VQVEFRTRQLLRRYQQSQRAFKAWGEKVGRRYIERVNILKAAKSLDDLFKVPGLGAHPLKGNKAGRYSLTLVDRWRMEVSFADKAKTIVQIEEVSAHYGD
jgi:toxin HigB-1